MNQVFKMFVSLSLSGSLISIFLFIIKPIIKNRISQIWQYYIWLIVIFRLLVPFSYSNSLVGNLFEYLEDNKMMYQQYIGTEYGNENINTQIDYEKDDIELIASLDKNNSLKSTLDDLLTVIWLMIVIILLIRKITFYQSFLHYLKAGRKEIVDIDILNIYEEICQQLGIKKHIEIYTHAMVTTPIKVGALKSFIVLPNTNYNNVELKNIIQHELTHYKRKDVLYKWIIQIVVCLHWFNPIVIMFKKRLMKNVNYHVMSQLFLY